ncbi:MAG: RMD1 family protein [Comamonadaceae bacterium]|nr:RMD1 family protein [Comamonadaceae bacterium]
MAATPLTIPGTDGGFAVLFRFGVICAVGMTSTSAEQLLCRAKELVSAPRADAGMEDAEIIIAEGADEGVDTQGRIVLRDLSAGRAQVVASVLAKSAVLSDYEEESRRFSNGSSRSRRNCRRLACRAAARLCSGNSGTSC